MAHILKAAFGLLILGALFHGAMQAQHDTCAAPSVPNVVCGDTP